MDTSRFDRLTLSVSTLLTRRTLAGVLSLAALAFPHGIDGKKRKKRKKKKGSAQLVWLRECRRVLQEQWTVLLRHLSGQEGQEKMPSP